MENLRAKRSRHFRSANEECRQALSRLPDDLLKELDEQSSSSLYRHLGQCRSCFEAYLALQAAAELAGPLSD
ncbi:MAG: zf-HC2 domain-containing protein [Fuerstiella sp.]